MRTCISFISGNISTYTYASELTRNSYFKYYKPINGHFCATMHCSENANVQLPPSRHENISCRVSTAE